MKLAQKNERARRVGRPYHGCLGFALEPCRLSALIESRRRWSNDVLFDGLLKCNPSEDQA